MNTENIFEENIKVFERFCPELVEDVKNANCKNYGICRSENGDLNIRKKRDDGDFYFHSTSNPRKEADLWFNSIYEIGKVDIIVVFGIGLGYYYYPCKEWLEEDPERLLIFVEHDFSLLNMFFHTEQSRDVLGNFQVGIIGTKPESFEEDKFNLGNLKTIALLMPQHRSQFSQLKSYSKVHKPLWKKIKKTLQFLATETTQFMNFIMPKTLQEVACNGARNYWKLPDSKLFYALEGCLKGVPAVICGAGPSLLDDLPLLKEYKDTALIIGAGTGMNILNKNELATNLGVMLDPYDTTRSRILTNYGYEVPFCYELNVNYEALELIHGSKVYFRGYGSYGLNNYMEKKLGLDTYPPVYSPLSTTHCCLGIAMTLGCSPIILLGVDLAYTDRKRYPEDVKEHPLDKGDEHFHPTTLHHQQVLVSDAKRGGFVETRADWLREASLYEQFQKKYPKVRLINATSRGLLMSKVTSGDFEEIAQKEFKCVFDLENLIHAEIQNCPDLEITKENVKEVMTKWVEKINEIMALITDIMEELTGVFRRINENPELEEDYPTKTLIELRRRLRSDDFYRSFLFDEERKFRKFYFSKQYPLLFRPDQFENHEKTIQEIQLEMGHYLYFIYVLQIVQGELEKSLLIEQKGWGATSDERGTTREALGNEDLSNNDVYSFEGGKLVIHDEELNFHWEEEYIPKKISGGRDVAEDKIFKYASTKNGLPDGHCLSYYPSGKVKGECFYKDGKIHGPSTFYSENGKVLAKGWFIENMKQGKNFQYYSSENIYSIKRFKDGKNHGRQEYFYESGAKKTSMSFCDGRLEGDVILYYPTGEGKRTVQFQNGLMNGFERMWDINGQLVLESEYFSNIPVGYSRSWYPTGQIKQEKKFYDSPENYDFTSWNEDGEITKKTLFMPDGINKIMKEKSDKTRHDLNSIKEKLSELDKG